MLEPLGLTHPQYLVMLALWERAPLSIKEIGELLRLEPATVSPLVKRLETNGLLVRERHPHDDRALQVRLTRRGRDLRTQALTVPPQIVARLGMEVVGASGRCTRRSRVSSPPPASPPSDLASGEREEELLHCGLVLVVDAVGGALRH